VINQDVLKGVLTLVLNHGVFESRAAASVAEVAVVVREWKPQLAVIDMDIAEGKLIGALANATSTSDRIPVIALTRRGDLKTKLSAFDWGADDILTLPFSPEELVARALVIMRRKYGASARFEPRIAFAGLEIDMLNRRVYEGNAELHLTPIEQSLLYLLAANAQRLLSRTEIVDTVWGSDFVGDLSVVDRHVRNLRAKFENDGLHSYIVTVPGRGYRFTPRVDTDATPLSASHG
jgi:DNA-binding response OmpR family regulator